MSSFFGGQSQLQPASNIFGNLGTSTSSSAQSQPGQTSSLFGSSQPQQTGNIFGNLNTSKPQPTPSLFSNLGGQSTSQLTGSVFGTTASSQPQQAGLFGTLGSTTATTSQPQQGGTFGPLGGTTAPSSKPQQGGAFGSFGGSTSQPQQGGAFASFGGTTSTSQPQNPAFSFGNLGGSTATNSQPQQPGLSFGIPGANTNQNQNQQPSGQPAQSNGNTLHSAYFNSLLEKNRKRDRATAANDSGFGEVPSLQLGLGDIAKRVRELGGTGVQNLGRGTDTKAHYLLAASGVNPGAALRDLNAFNAQASTTAGTQPRPDWDPDSHKYVEQLMQQSTMKMIQEGISIAHRSFDTFIEENVDIDWNTQRRKLYEHFGLVPKGGDKLSDSTYYSIPGGKGSFGRSSRAGRGSKAGPDRQETPGRSVFGKSGMQKSVIGTTGAGSDNASVFRDVADKSSQGPSVQDNRFLREKQSRFADKVQRLNEARLQELAYPVLQEFAGVEGQPGGDSPSQLLDAYKAVIEMVKENPDVTSLTDPRAVIERQFTHEYLDESQLGNALKMRQTLLDGSRRALEKQFFSQLESLVARNPREASLGGIPTVLNKVRAYIRLRNSRKDLAPGGIILQQLNDDYCWALIYFLLRTGLVNEAAEYVTNNSVAFRALDRNFITYITQYASNSNRRLSRHHQDRINTDYQQRSRIAPENTLDPYRMACYKVIGRCELNKRSIDGISQGVEDWIWLQFALAREVNRAEEAANEVYGLEEVRDTIREIGQRHFSKGSEGPGGYGTFFFLQVLGGLFEQAVAYLYSHSYVAAVHFAIALDFYGLLRVADFSESELLTYNTKELPQISFGRMIGYYTRDFRAGNVVAAVDYLTLICLNADLPGEIGKSQSSLCHEALRELVLETREFAQLLGDIRGDGVRIRGAIEQRLKLIGIADQEGFLRTVTLQAASVAADNGRTTDAVLLYHLAEDYDDVITIINGALSDAIAVDIGQEQPRLQPLKPRTGSAQYHRQQQQQPDNSSLSLTTVDDPAILARNMISLYNDNALYYQKIRPVNRETCGVLLRISEAKAKVESGQWAEALDIISSLKLLPLSANSSIPIIRAHAQTLTTLHPTVCRLAGPLLLWTITCISRQREVLSGEGGQGGFESDTRRAIREELVGKAKDLMVFAGLVKLRLGKDVWDGIVGGAGELGVY
ncbi:Nucleoporin nup93 [Trapelia coarctata]|nr:Nucleoporin nup93 [Trapelia coarctata]